MSILKKLGLALLGPVGLAELRNEHINSISKEDLGRAELNTVTGEWFRERLTNATPLTVETYASRPAKDQIGRSYTNNLTGMELFSLTRRAFHDPILIAGLNLLGGSEKCWVDLLQIAHHATGASNNRLVQRKEIQNALDELFGAGSMEVEKAGLVGLLHARALQLRAEEADKAPVA